MAIDDDQKKCGGLTLGGLLLLLFSAALIVVGLMHVDLDSDDPVRDGECYAQPNIPVFLVVMGVLLLASAVLRCIFQRLCRKCGDTDDKICSTINFGCNFTCLLLYDILVFIVVISWLSEYLIDKSCNRLTLGMVATNKIKNNITNNENSKTMLIVMIVDVLSSILRSDQLMQLEKLCTLLSVDNSSIWPKKNQVWMRSFVSNCFFLTEFHLVVI